MLFTRFQYQFHDGIDDIAVVLLERANDPVPARVGLLHHEFDGGLLLRLYDRLARRIGAVVYGPSVARRRRRHNSMIVSIFDLDYMHSPAQCFLIGKYHSIKSAVPGAWNGFILDAMAATPPPDDKLPNDFPRAADIRADKQKARERAPDVEFQTTLDAIQRLLNRARHMPTHIDELRYLMSPDQAVFNRIAHVLRSAGYDVEEAKGDGELVISWQRQLNAPVAANPSVGGMLTYLMTENVNMLREIKPTVSVERARDRDIYTFVLMKK